VIIYTKNLEKPLKNPIVLKLVLMGRKLLPKVRVITTEEVVKFIIAREEAEAEKAIKDAAKITTKTVAKTANPGPK
jgi:hypothetical protein